MFTYSMFMYEVIRLTDISSSNVHNIMYNVMHVTTSSNIYNTLLTIVAIPLMCFLTSPADMQQESRPNNYRKEYIGEFLLTL